MSALVVGNESSAQVDGVDNVILLHIICLINRPHQQHQGYSPPDDYFCVSEDR